MATINKIIKNGKNSDCKVLSNMALVYHIAKKYQGMGITLEDLISEGTVGLVKATEKFEEGKGLFSTYAYTWIKATIIQALNETSRTVRIPSHIAGNKELAAAVEVKVATIEEKHNWIADEDSLDSDSTDCAELTDTQLIVKGLLSKLKEKDQLIVSMKFGIGYPDAMEAKEIAIAIGLSPQMVNFRLKRAIADMAK